MPVDDLQTLSFEHVTFPHLTAASPALTDVSFDVQRGDTVAFVGPSGAGKSTLVKLLVGLYRPQDGQILYNGHAAATRWTSISLRERIGFVTQDTQLFSGSIRENLRFVRPEATDAECLDVLQQAACDSLLARADKGLDTVIGEGGVKVSGGEKQRLSIARALLRRPHLLVFDEATSSLDSITEEEISQTIRDVNRAEDVITILIAHRLSTIMHADRIYVLERGRIVEEGRHDSCSSSRACTTRCGASRWASADASTPRKVRVIAGATVPAPRARRCDRPVRAQILQHVPFESPGSIATTLQALGAALESRRACLPERCCRAATGVDLLVRAWAAR